MLYSKVVRRELKNGFGEPTGLFPKQFNSMKYKNHISPMRVKNHNKISFIFYFDRNR